MSLRFVSFVLMTLLGLPVTGNTGRNPDASCRAAKALAATVEGYVDCPLGLTNVSSLKAVEVLVRYEGTISGVEFVPSSYLHSALVTPLVIDNSARTIRFSVAATRRVVSRQGSGTLGSLRFPADSAPRSIEVVGVQLVDEDYALDALGELATDNVANFGVAAEEASPFITGLGPLYPNPGNPTVTISFELAVGAHVRMTVYDVTGRAVRTLANRIFQQGNHRAVWDGLDDNGQRVASGVYFVQMQTPAFSQSRKLTLLK